ncbi:MAG: ABC-type sugar transport system ATPase subunit [Gammaproteobacteria bacterium]
MAKALSIECKLLILDEPTAAFTGSQAAHLHKIIREMSLAGTSIIYISHRLKDVLEISDTVTVLRDGRIVKTTSASVLKVSDLLEQMSGHIHPENRSPPNNAFKNSIVLEARRITSKDLPHEINFTCYAGEIIGLAGLSGSGRSELLNALFGLSALTGGRICRHTVGGLVDIKNPVTAKELGMAYLGEDRQSMGLYSGHSILMNMMTPGPSHAFGPLTLLDSKKEKSSGADLVNSLSIKCTGLHQDIDQLSGGNQQKALIARWLHCDSDIFLFDEPTRGVDVSTKTAIYNLMFQLREKGKTILIASSEIEELIMVSSRIFVLSNRKLVKEFKPDNWSESAILEACFSEFAAQAANTKSAYIHPDV